MDKHLMEQLKRHEGTRRDADGFHRAYRCPAGFLTIGYGHNLEANPVPGIGGDSRLTNDQAERLLAADINKARKDLATILPWTGALDSVRQAVLVNMLFNLGAKGLLGFRNTLTMIKSGNYAGAAAGLLASRWAGQVGARALELAGQMRSGQWRKGVPQ